MKLISDFSPDNNYTVSIHLSWILINSFRAFCSIFRWKCFFCCSVWRGLEEMDRVSVIRTSEALAVSTARPPTNMDQTVTEVSLSHLYPWHHTGRCDVRMMKVNLCEPSPVCPQPVSASMDNVITVRTQTVGVNRTPVWQVSPVGSANAERRPAAFRFSSVTLMQTATSARQPPGEFTSIHHTLNSELLVNPTSPAITQHMSMRGKINKSLGLLASYN